MIIENLNAYFDTSILRSRRAILFQWLLPRLGSQAHFNAMCFSFAAKMVADTNQLKNYVSERRQGKQVQNKERHFEEVAKGKYARTRVCLTMKTTHLKRFMPRFI